MDIFKEKRVRYGGYAALVTLAAVVILVVVNLIIQQFPASIDMTENRLFTLSDQTLELLDELESDINIYGLYRPGSENPNVVNVLEKYQRASNHITVEYMDPDRNPAFLRKYAEEGQTLSNGTLIVDSGTVNRTISSIDLYDVSYSQQGEPRVMGFKAEQRITNALLYVTSGFTPRIYVLTGHREYDLSQLNLRSTVENENYEIESLNLLQRPDVPEDAAMVLVMYPESDLNEREAEALLEYLEADGSGFFLFHYIGRELPQFNGILESFGVTIDQAIVMEGNRNHLYNPDNPLFLSPVLEDHEITDPLSENNMTILMSNSMPVRTLEIRKRNIVIEPLLTTTTQSWVRTDTENGSLQKQPDDPEGPVDLAVAISRQKETMDEPEGFRLVVAGNAQFVGPMPPFGNLKPNTDFFLNSLSWLNKRSDSISVRSKSLFELPLRMSGTMQLVYAGVFIVLIPLGILVAGLIVWLRRRHL